jgi:hypothetical protein
MIRKLAILSLVFAVSGCVDAAINLGIQVGTEVIGAGVGAIIKKSDIGPSADQGKSVLVCNPPDGDKVTDPTTQCHSETKTD